MHKLILFLGICSGFALGSKLPVLAKDCEKIIACYCTLNLGDDYPGPTLLIEDIDVSLCTHVFYSFIRIVSDGSIVIFNPGADIYSDGFKRFNNLRKKKPQLKTLVSMGDFTDSFEDKKTNIEIMTDPTLREKIVGNIVNFVKKYGFNGIDLRITDRPQYGGRSPNKNELVLFLKALREQFNKKGFILSVTVDPNEATAKILYDIKGISTYVNFINLRTDNFRGISDADLKLGVGHSSPMYPSSKESAEERKKNIDYVVKYWISRGARPSKLILGTAFHGIRTTLINPKQIGRGAPTTIGRENDGDLDYNKICPLVKNPRWKHLYDKEQEVPYIYAGNAIIAYDDAESIKKKAEYTVKMKLGGAAVWTIDGDDFYGACGKKYPLLKTLNRVLRNKC